MKQFLNKSPISKTSRCSNETRDGLGHQNTTVLKLSVYLATSYTTTAKAKYGD